MARKKQAKKMASKDPRKAKKRVVKARKKAQKPKKKQIKKPKAVQATCKKVPKAVKKEERFSLGERLYHLLTETSVVVYASKPSGNYGATFISDNVKRLTGYTYRAFLRDPRFWVDRVHPDDRGRVLQEIPRLFKEGYYEYEYRFRHKKGHYIWVRDEMRCVCDENGKCVEIVGYWTNITKRKTAEVALKVSTDRLQKFMDSATEGFVIVDPGFKIIKVNRYLLDQFGFVEENVVGLNFLDLSRDAYESGRYEKYIEVLETGKSCVFDDLPTPPEYGDRRMTVRAFKVGDCLGLILRDVTREKKREQQLLETEEQLRSIYDSLNAGIVIHDTEGVVVSANKRACEILDIEEEELVGADMNELCSNIVNDKGQKIEAEDHPLTMTLQTTCPVRNQTVGLLSDEPAKSTWLLVNTEPIFDPETDKLEQVLCTFIDITEQKNIGDALEESEERYRHIFENSPIGIGISGMDGRVITANNAMLEITGYSLDEFRKINIADTYVSVDDRRRLLQALNQYGRVTDYLVRLKRKDGTSYDAILNITRINLGGTDYYHTMCQRATLREDK
jgi:PAS domain S-box-containing protein